MNLSEMKAVLSQRGIQLTRSLGQNFMHDGNQLRRMIALADLKPGMPVFEIGPGLGPLTQGLLENGPVLAIEKDQRLVDVLRERFKDQARLELVHSDALQLLRAGERQWSDWSVVSNLPYSVASPILVELSLGETCPRMMVVTLQAEVVDRIIAKPESKTYGVLTLLVRIRYEAADSFRISAECFFPAPDVASACVELVRRETELLLADERRLYVYIVKRSFSQRRKKMINLLKERWTLGELERVFVDLGIRHDARAEHVTFEQYVRLTKQLKGNA